MPGKAFQKTADVNEFTVFGFVFEGMEVVDTIVNAESRPNGPGGAPAPIVPIVIKKMSRITYE